MTISRRTASASPALPAAIGHHPQPEGVHAAIGRSAGAQGPRDGHTAPRLDPGLGALLELFDNGGGDAYAQHGFLHRPHTITQVLEYGLDHAIAWLQSDLAQFFEDFSGELPSALERVLGNQVHDVKPRWAKGTAHRVARLLSDHIDELERKDALLGDVFAGAEGGHRG